MGRLVWGMGHSFLKRYLVVGQSLFYMKKGVGQPEFPLTCIKLKKN